MSALTRLKDTTRTLMKAVKTTNRGIVYGKGKRALASAPVDRKKHADMLRGVKKKLGRKAYIEHRLNAAKNSESLRKNSRTKAGYHNW